LRGAFGFSSFCDAAVCPPGGHDVPEDKIRQRYQRPWALVAAAINRCDSATVYDNTALKGPRIVAQMSSGHVVGSPDWPTWTPGELSSRWGST